MTQIERARKGEVTPEMEFVAARELLAPELILDEVAAGRMVIPANKVHLAKNLEPMGIGWDPAASGFPGPDLRPLVTGAGLAGASLNGDGTLYFDLHHTAEDTLDKIEAPDLAYNTAAYAALLYLVAEYDGRFDAAAP